MEKLTKILGVETYLIYWIQDFLCDRSETVVLVGAKSQSLLGTSGVPPCLVRVSMPESVKSLPFIPKEQSLSDLISDKISNVSKQIGMIRRALYLALERARLIAEKSLCLPHLEFASCAWDSFANKNIEALELDRCEGVRIICDQKGRRGVMEAKEKLELQPLNVRRQKPRLKLLLKILSERDSLPALCASYDEILNQTESTIWSRSQYRKEPRYIATSRS